MGNRRMISKTVTQTQRFLRLPLEAQALYFHLIQNADDDGIVEAFPVIRMIGANEDNLGLLVVKNYIKPLNDEMVYFLIDFHEQNAIRKDRYKKSIHSDLLETAKNQGFEALVSDGFQNGNQMATSGCLNISKDKLSKDKLSQKNIAQQNSAAAEISQYFQSRIGLLDGSQYQQLMDYHAQDLMELDLIKLAISKAADNSKRSFGYVNAILKGWAQNGIRTVLQQEEEQEAYNAAKGYTQKASGSAINTADPFGGSLS